MIDHYNAFISYRHADKDIKVAKAIQSDLEHFHIPRKIKKETGMKSINRIFLDKDELGTASDLSTEIAHALENADYLIVICSTATKESKWVPREIEYFLRNHTRRQITTVLVDGEPEDVIPDILKYEDRTFKNEYGQSYTVRVPLEPLSCDYRMSHSRAKKEELPRLASALLGCSYDELMNRRRQYKIRRLSLIFAVFMIAALAFGLYSHFSRLKIRSNYEASLRNQSLYLANESIRVSEKEQRILAIQLALAALPEDEDDPRPITPQAIHALTNSTQAYKSLQGNNIEAVWNYDMSDHVNEYYINSNGTILAAVDYSGNVCAWNTTNHKLLLTTHVATTSVEKIHFLSDNQLLIQSDYYIQLYNLDTGKKLWQYDSKDILSYTNRFDRFEDGSILAGTNNMLLLRIDAKTGDVISKYQLSDDKSSLRHLALSPDGTRAAYVVNDFTSGYTVGIYNLNDKTNKLAATPLNRIRDLSWADDDHLMVATSEDEEFSGSMFTGNVSVLEESHSTVRCMDTGTLKELWSQDFPTHQVMINSGFLYLPKKKAVAYYMAERAEIYNISDGSKIAVHVSNDSLVEISDLDGDGWPLYIGQGGTLIQPIDADTAKATKWFPSNLNNARVGNGVFVHEYLGRQIIHYKTHVQDEEWTSLDKEIKLNSPGVDYILDDAVLATLTQEDAAAFPDSGKPAETRIPVLTLFNPIQGEALYRIPMPYVDSRGAQLLTSQYNLLGSAGSCFYFAYQNFDSAELHLVSVDLSTGELSENVLCSCTYTIRTGLAKSGNYLYYYDQEEDNNRRSVITIYDLVTGKKENLPVKESVTALDPAMPPLELTGENAFFCSDGENNYIVYKDGRPSEEIALPEGWLTTKYAAYNQETKRLALSDGDHVRLVSIIGEDPIEINDFGIQPCGLTLYTPRDDEGTPLLLVAYVNNTLYRYNAKTGAFIGRSEISGYANSKDSFIFDLNVDDDLIYISQGSITNMIETKSWVEQAYIENCFGHHRLTDRIFTYSYIDSRECEVGYFRHYTLDELMQKARDILQGTEMSEDTKTEYGIISIEDE